MTWGRAGDIVLRETIAPKIQTIIGGDCATEYKGDMPAGYDPKGPDLRFVSTSHPTQRVAVAIFGPYKDERLYSYRRDDYLLKILGLPKAYGTVAGIVPGYEREAEFEKWLDHFADPKLHFIIWLKPAGLTGRTA